MALGASYATVLDLETRLGRSDDGTFADKLKTASQIVEAFTRRQFNKVTAPSPRRFRAIDPRRLPVDDFYTTDGLAIDVEGTAWAVTDVEPRPWDGIVNGQAGWPYFDLIAKTKTWPYKHYPVVTVTAVWGWASVPEAIVQATLDVAEVMSFGTSSGGVVRSKAIDGYSVTYSVPELSGATQAPPELVKAAPYRKLMFGVA